jgi:hypothetical protein
VFPKIVTGSFADRLALHDVALALETDFLARYRDAIHQDRPVYGIALGIDE